MRNAQQPATDSSTEVLFKEGPKALAKRRGVSVRTLRRRFLDFGTTLGGFLRARRAALAVQLLAQPGALVRDAARRLGFSSDAAFIRFFKREFGRTPGELRDELAPPDEKPRKPPAG